MMAENHLELLEKPTIISRSPLHKDCAALASGLEHLIRESDRTHRVAAKRVGGCTKSRLSRKGGIRMVYDEQSLPPSELTGLALF